MITKNKNKNINLKYSQAREYCDQIENQGFLNKIIDKLYMLVLIMGVLSILSFSLGYIKSQFTFASSNEQKMSVRDKIRFERLEVCQNAYKNSGINKQFIYGQMPVVRCATYMGLIYAYESNFGKSRKCIKTNNCFGLKGNGYDTPVGFLKFKNQTEARRYFAKKYFKYHYKKKINQFVNSRSMTDIKTYKNFLHKRFKKMYGDLEYLFMTN